MKAFPKYPNLYENGRFLFTASAYPGTCHFEERIRREGGLEYREFRPDRSKLAAAIAKNISQVGIKPGNNVLYLGASHGYTPSFISDMVGKHGMIFGIDVAPQVVRNLYFVSQKRNNIAPILANCNHPESYQHLIVQCDILYQDIAQRNQVEIFLKNLQFLKKGGFGILAIKSRSIDVTKKPKLIFKQVRLEMEKKITVVDYRELDPFEKDHALFVLKK
ncbi:MAG: fibrillarin-like rRNA/tRNA 2'-O-methyltransferase [Nanoarchaeota archaeon]|nr:fibrillarin-like rRNA/tRNA 2'-O-methyltransferase [Nanoarchaeota archaeon]